MAHYNVGQKIRIIHMDDNNGKDVQAHEYNGKVGIIKHIDGIGQLHLEGGGLAVNPEIDEIEIIWVICIIKVLFHSNFMF